MIVIHAVKQGSEAWHKLRKGLWTGSRAIKLLKGKTLPDDSNSYQSGAMLRGKVLEPIAIQEYEREMNTCVLRHGFITNSVYPNAGYSPDGVDGKILLEVKCFNLERHDMLKKGEIPAEIMAQIQFGMVITGLRKARLIAYNPDDYDQLVVIDVPYNKVIANNIRRKLKADLRRRNLGSSS